MIGRLIKWLGGFFWLALLVVILFIVGMWALGKLKGLPVVGPIAGGIQNAADPNG